jgi:hypothetical protein
MKEYKRSPAVGAGCGEKAPTRREFFGAAATTPALAVVATPAVGQAIDAAADPLAEPRRLFREWRSAHRATRDISDSNMALHLAGAPLAVQRAAEPRLDHQVGVECAIKRRLVDAILDAAGVARLVSVPEVEEVDQPRVAMVLDCWIVVVAPVSDSGR